MKNNIPKLRFSEFEGKWSEHRFGDLVQIERGGSPRPIEDYITNASDGLNWVKIGDVSASERYITKTAEKIKPEGLSKTRKVKQGDLILSNSMSFGRPYIMGIDGCIHDGWLVIRDNSKLFDTDFLYSLLGTSQMFQQYKILAAGSTVNNLNKELVSNTIVTIPLLSEQKKLGSFFQKLDHLIQLQEKRLKLLKQAKKGLLQQMLPKNGETVPEMRFKEFAGEWEDAKLENVASGFNYGMNASAILYDGKHKYIRITDIDDESHKYKDKNPVSPSEKPEDKYKVKENDILFARTGSVGKSYLYDRLDKDLYFAGYLIRVHINDDTDSRFVFLNTMTHKYEKWVVVESVKSVQLGLNAEQYKNYSFPIPTLPEQQKLASFLTKLEDLISASEKELNDLRTLKKGLLQQMFVS